MRPLDAEPNARQSSARQALLAEVRGASADPRRRLGRYVLLDAAQRRTGGWSCRGWDAQHDRQVLVRAIEYPAAAAASLRARANLRQPNLALLLDSGTDQGRSFVTLELPGQPLLASRADPTAAVAAIASALGGVLRQGYSGWELSPETIYVDEAGHAKLAGLGPGFSLQGPTAAPELARGAAPSARSDVFALGATLRAAAPRGQRGIEAVCRRCLDPDPSRRFASASEVAAALERLLRPPQTRRLVLPLAVGLALVVGALGWWAFGGSRSATAPAPSLPSDVSPPTSTVESPPPIEVDPRLAAVHDALSRRAFDEARERVDGLLEQDPELAAALAVRGQLQARGGKNAEALVDFERAEALGHVDKQLLYWRAAALYGLNRDPEALDALSRLDDLPGPDPLPGYRHELIKGMALFRSEDWESAYAVLHTYLEHAPRDDWQLLNTVRTAYERCEHELGREPSRLGAFAELEARVSYLVRKGPAFAHNKLSSFDHLITAYEEAGRTDDVREVLNLRLQTHPWDSASQLRLAKLDLELSRDEQAALRLRALAEGAPWISAQVSQEASRLLAGVGSSATPRPAPQALRNSTLLLLGFTEVPPALLAEVAALLRAELGVQVAVLPQHPEPDPRNAEVRRAGRLRGLLEFGGQSPEADADLAALEAAVDAQLARPDCSAQWAGFAQDQRRPCRDLLVLCEQARAEASARLEDVETIGLLALTGFDGVLPGANFNYAVTQGGVSVLSTARLLSSGSAGVKAQALASVGHLLELPRCGFPGCARAFVPSAVELAWRGDALCPECIRAIEELR